MNSSKREGWLQRNLQDPEFKRYLAREDLIEHFLNAIDSEMSRRGVSRAELARRMGCRPSNVTQILRRTRNLTVATMVDIAFHLDLRLELVIRPDEGAIISDSRCYGKLLPRSRQGEAGRIHFAVCRPARCAPQGGEGNPSP